MEMLQTWLLRSHNSPLTLSVNTKHIRDYVILSSIDVMITNCRHWQNVKFTLPGSLFRMFSAVAGLLPMLQKLCIEMMHTEIQSLGAFKVAPLLCDMTFVYNTSPVSICLPWQQLKQCNVCYLVADCLYIIQKSPELVHCRLECMGCENLTTNLLETPMLQTHLCSLQLVIEEKVDLVNIMDSITASALDELDIEQAKPFPYAIWTQDHLSSFLTRSCSMIRCLRLREVTIPKDELIICLQGLPLLTDLEIHVSWEMYL
jgi:hypothetical protein